MSSSGDENDEAIQRDLLKALEQYGDNLLGEKSKGKPRRELKKSKSKKTQNEDTEKGKESKRRITAKASSGKFLVRQTEAQQKIKELTRGPHNQAQNSKLKDSDQHMDRKQEIKQIQNSVSSRQVGKVTGKKSQKNDDLSDSSDSGSDQEEEGLVGFESDESLGDDDLSSAFDSDSDLDNNQPKKALTGKQKQLQKMREALGLLDEDFLKAQKAVGDKSVGVKSTACKADLRPIQRKRPPPEVVVYESYSKKKKQMATTGTKSKATSDRAAKDEGPLFDIKEARHEVQQFGITGLEGPGKQDAVTAMLIGLGARAPKKEYVNYKQLQETKKVEQVDAQKQREWDRSMGFRVSSSAKRYSANRAQQKRDLNDLGVLDGQVGSYRGGVQRLSKGEVTQITTSNNKRKRR